MLDVTASKTSLEKVLGFANDLFNALEARGYRVTLAPSGHEFRRDDVGLRGTKQELELLLPRALAPRTPYPSLH